MSSAVRRSWRSGPWAGCGSWWRPTRSAELDPSGWELEVGFLRHDAPPIDGSRLADPQRTVLVHIQEREVLTARPREGGSRPHVNTLLERATGSKSTARGWSTLRRIADKG